MVIRKQITKVIVVDRLQIIEQVLQSLEYQNARKVEDDIVVRLCERFNVSPKLQLKSAAKAFAQAVTAEIFLGEVLRLLGPYVSMLRDIYRLLANAGATESGTADKLRLDDRGMRRECRDLPISDAFLQRIRETYSGWRERQLVEVEWGKLEQLLIYDGRFYGEVDGVYLPQVLTFAPTLIHRLLSRGLSIEASRIDAALTDVQQCLEAIVKNADSSRLSKESSDVSNDTDSAFDSNMPLVDDYKVYIKDDLPSLDTVNGASFILSLPQAMSGIFPPSSNQTTHTSNPEHSNVIGGILMLLTVLCGRIERPWPDYPDPPNKFLLQPLEEFDQNPDEFAERIEQFVRILNEIAHPIGTLHEQALFERVLEMIDLPFWKDRARLYEVWVLVRTAQAVSAIPFLRAVPRLSLENDTCVLKLPKSDAKHPIFDIEICADEPRKAALLWFQRRTPDMQRSLFRSYEPDVRCTRASSPFADLFIVECKDREALRRRHRTRGQADGEGFQDVAEKYLNALAADLLWLVNYSAFAEQAASILCEDRRTAHFAEKFHPGNTPTAFDSSIRDVLEWQLKRFLPAKAAVANAPPDAGTNLRSARLTLTWQNTPRDLDLHLWRERYPQVIGYGNRGSLTQEPWAQLSEDMKQGYGPEEINIARLMPVRYVVAVHNYSADSPLAGSAALLKFELGGNPPLTVTVPIEGEGAWWHVLDIDGAHGAIQIVNRIHVKSPWGT